MIHTEDRSIQFYKWQLIDMIRVRNIYPVNQSLFIVMGIRSSTMKRLEISRCMKNNSIKKTVERWNNSVLIYDNCLSRRC